MEETKSFNEWINIFKSKDLKILKLQIFICNYENLLDACRYREARYYRRKLIFLNYKLRRLINK